MQFQVFTHSNLVYHDLISKSEMCFLSFSTRDSTMHWSAPLSAVQLLSRRLNMNTVFPMWLWRVSNHPHPHPHPPRTPPNYLHHVHLFFLLPVERGAGVSELGTGSSLDAGPRRGAKKLLRISVSYLPPKRALLCASVFLRRTVLCKN